MYRCRKCGGSSVVGEVRKLLIQLRTVEDEETHRVREEIKVETPVCMDCFNKHHGIVTVKPKVEELPQEQCL